MIKRTPNWPGSTKQCIPATEDRSLFDRSLIAPDENLPDNTVIYCRQCLLGAENSEVNNYLIFGSQHGLG